MPRRLDLVENSQSLRCSPLVSISQKASRPKFMNDGFSTEEGGLDLGIAAESRRGKGSWRSFPGGPEVVEMWTGVLGRAGTLKIAVVVEDVEVKDFEEDFD
jgi:hypothetical protein